MAISAIKQCSGPSLGMSPCLLKNQMVGSLNPHSLSYFGVDFRKVGRDLTGFLENTQKAPQFFPKEIFSIPPGKLFQPIRSLGCTPFIQPPTESMISDWLQRVVASQMASKKQVLISETEAMAIKAGLNSVVVPSVLFPLETASMRIALQPKIPVSQLISSASCLNTFFPRIGNSMMNSAFAFFFPTLVQEQLKGYIGDPTLRKAAADSSCMMMGPFLTIPLDVVVTQMVVDSKTFTQIKNDLPQGLIKKLRAIYLGLGLQVARNGIYFPIWLGCYEKLKRKPDEHSSVIYNIGINALIAAATTLPALLATTPLSTIQGRMTGKPKDYPTIRKTVEVILSEEGLNLWQQFYPGFFSLRMARKGLAAFITGGVFAAVDLAVARINR